MNYPKRNIIVGMLIFLGTYPFHEKRQRTWSKKIHLFGLFLCCVQCTLTVYTFVLEQRNCAYSSHTASNNILLGSVAIKKTLALGLPLFIVFFKFFNMRPLEEFYEKTELFDVFYKATEIKELTHEFICLQQEVDKKIRKMNFVCGVLIILVELFNVVTAISYMIVARGGVPNIETIYFYHSSIAIFITSSLHVFSKLFGLMLRHELFNAFVQGVWEEGWPMEREIKMKRRQAVYNYVRSN